jgi:hypothetical protein
MSSTTAIPRIVGAHDSSFFRSMRAHNSITATPSAARNSCFIRKKLGSW